MIGYEKYLDMSCSNCNKQGYQSRVEADYYLQGEAKLVNILHNMDISV